MPRIAGVGLGAWVASSLAFWLVGSIWYGAVFSDMWMAAAGITEADFANSDPSWMMLGFVIPFLVTFGIAKVLQMGEATDPDGRT